MKKQGIDYTNQDFFLGIDVHQKNWIVTITVYRRTHHDGSTALTMMAELKLTPTPCHSP